MTLSVAVYFCPFTVAVIVTVVVDLGSVVVMLKTALLEPTGMVIDEPGLATVALELLSVAVIADGTGPAVNVS